ncbi:hypothetical protein MAHJHV47_40920 [Mycobacterium avium subsp. hominissuis]
MQPEFDAPGSSAISGTPWQAHSLAASSSRGSPLLRSQSVPRRVYAGHFLRLLGCGLP